MKLQIPKIYPVTDGRVSGLSHLLQVQALIAGGASFIQLREKYASPKDFFAAAEPALAFARENNAKIIINDRVDIALAIRADGVHLGQDDLPPAHARKILGDAAIIGYSTHSVEQAEKALTLPINYIAIGPIFATTTKEDPDKTVGLEGLRKVREAIGDFPLVAIGGITLANIAAVIHTGADSAAVISGLLSDPSQIAARTKHFLQVNEQ